MKLVEIIEMLKPFGFTEGHVRRALATQGSAAEAFERIKTALQIRWRVMCQELSAERCAELRPIYDRLMSLTMKSRVTKAEVDQKVSDVFADMAKNKVGQNLREAFDFAAECRQRQVAAEQRKQARKAAKKAEKRNGKPVIDVKFEEKKDG